MRSRRRSAIVAIVVACAVAGLALATPTDALARWFAHPARVDAAGHVPDATIAGARVAKIAWAVGPFVLLALAFVAKRLLARRTIERESSAVPHPAPHSAPAAPSRSSLLTLTLIVVLATVLRGLRLGDSLWYDELAGLLGYSIHGPGVVIGNYFSQANHIASQLAIWASTALLGVDELSVRLPSLIAGVATVPAAWALGREARGEGTGLFAATAVALMPVAALASCDARGYAMVILFATIATWLLLRARRETGGHALWWWSAYALVIALLAWTHLAAVCVALGHGAMLAIDLTTRRDRCGAIIGLVSLVAAATCTIMLYAPALPDLVALREQFRMRDVGEPRLLGPELQHALLAWGGSWTWWATLPGAIVAMIGVAPTVRDPRLRRAFALAAMGGPIAVALAGFADSWLYARFLLFLVPATALLIAAGFATIARAGRLAVAVAAAAIALASATDLIRLPPRQPLRDAIARAAELRAAAHDAGPVGTIGLIDQVQLYYTEAAKLPVVDFGDRGKNVDAMLPSVRPRVLVMLYPSAVSDATKATLARNGYAITERLDGWIDWGKGTIEIWTRP